MLFRRFSKGDPSYIRGIISKYSPRLLLGFEKMFHFVDSFDETLDRSASNALWLCTSSALAVKAYQRTKHQPQTTRKKIHILDIHNNSLSHKYGISSCIADYHTIGYLLAHSLLCDLPVKHTRKGYINTPTLLIRRSTTPVVP